VIRFTNSGSDGKGYTIAVTLIKEPYLLQKSYLVSIHISGARRLIGGKELLKE
jgi:hypothetical protein